MSKINILCDLETVLKPLPDREGVLKPFFWFDPMRQAPGSFNKFYKKEMHGR
jgi:hypothetical protein